MACGYERSTIKYLRVTYALQQLMRGADHKGAISFLKLSEKICKNVESLISRPASIMVEEQYFIRHTSVKDEGPIAHA